MRRADGLGVLVAHDGTVYAAAGIAHYDGTHVVALDAATGEVRWYNDSSGQLSAKVNSGISLQGSLYLRGNELRFRGGEFTIELFKRSYPGLDDQPPTQQPVPGLVRVEDEDVSAEPPAREGAPTETP